MTTITTFRNPNGIIHTQDTLAEMAELFSDCISSPDDAEKVRSEISRWGFDPRHMTGEKFGLLRRYVAEFLLA